MSVQGSCTRAPILHLDGDTGRGCMRRDLRDIAGQVVSSVAWTSEEHPKSFVSSLVHLGERVVPGRAPASNGELHGNRCVMPVLAGGSCGPTLLLPGALLLVSPNDREVQIHLPEEPSHHATCHDSRTCPAGVMAVTEHLHFQRPVGLSHQGSRALSLHRGSPHSSGLGGLRSDIN